MTLKGIDVSSYQGSIDWAKVRASGIEFAITRCVREIGTVDERYVENIDRMRSVGILPGAYCFLDEGSASAQAKLTIDSVRATGLGQIIVLDVERGEGTLPTISDIRTWTGLVRNSFPYTPIVLYGSPGVLVELGNLAGWGPWWRAHYPVTDGVRRTWDQAYAIAGGDASGIWIDDASGWTRAAIWQFTSKGSVPGIAGDVDLNATKLTRGQLEALAGLVTPNSTVRAIEESNAKIIEGLEAGAAELRRQRDECQAQLTVAGQTITELRGENDRLALDLKEAPDLERERIALLEAERIRAYRQEDPA